MEDVFFGTRTVGEDTYSIGDVELTCRTDERWKALHTVSSACGASTEYTVTKRIGLSRTDSDTLKASIGGTIGVPKLAELKAAIEGRIGREIKWDIGVETQQKHTIQAPPCGQRTDTLYQLYREHHFLSVRQGWFGRVHKAAWSVSEATCEYRLQPDVDVWTERCGCPKEVNPPRFDIAPATLRIGPVSLGLEIWSLGKRVFLNFTGRLAALDSPPDQPVRVDLPRSTVPSLVLWLAGRRGDPVEAVLVPNDEFLAETTMVGTVGQSQLEMRQAEVVDVLEPDRARDFEYEGS